MQADCICSVFLYLQCLSAQSAQSVVVEPRHLFGIKVLAESTRRCEGCIAQKYGYEHTTQQ